MTYRIGGCGLFGHCHASNNASASACNVSLSSLCFFLCCSKLLYVDKVNNSRVLYYYVLLYLCIESDFIHRHNMVVEEMGGLALHSLNLIIVPTH